MIEDVSNLTNDGWKGDKKWANLFQSAIFRNGHHNILVLDEADKMLSPRYSEHANVSHSIQSEGLTGSDLLAARSSPSTSPPVPL